MGGDLVKVFVIPFRVARLPTSIMPPHLKSAYVSCYAAGESYVEPAERAMQRLLADGLQPEEVLQPINQMDSDDWIIHIRHQWPEYVESLPDQGEFDEAMRAGKVVYGPFAVSSATSE